MKCFHWVGELLGNDAVRWLVRGLSLGKKAGVVSIRGTLQKQGRLSG